jgi:hypothetical protein
MNNFITFILKITKKNKWENYSNNMKHSSLYNEKTYEKMFPTLELK